MSSSNHPRLLAARAGTSFLRLHIRPAYLLMRLMAKSCVDLAFAVPACVTEVKLKLKGQFRHLKWQILYPHLHSDWLAVLQHHPIQPFP